LKISIGQNKSVALEAVKSVEIKIAAEIKSKGIASLVLATGSSQLLFLKALRERPISW